MAQGAAAYKTTNPGNLYFYQLCDERCDEFALLDSHTPERQKIVGEIVDAIIESGGVFRTSSGGVMTRAAALQKTRVRLGVMTRAAAAKKRSGQLCKMIAKSRVSSHVALSSPLSPLRLGMIVAQHDFEKNPVVGARVQLYAPVITSPIPSSLPNRTVEEEDRDRAAL